MPPAASRVSPSPPRRRARRLSAAALPALFAFVLLLAGCASTMAPHNGHVRHLSSDRGYRAGTIRPGGAPDSLVFQMSFSGGGTRAAALADADQRSGIRRVVHVVVNAQAHHDHPQLDHYAEVPTLSAIAFAVSNTTDRYNVETLAYAHSAMQDAARELAERQAAQGVPDGGDVQAMLIEVSFEDIDDDQRVYFNALPTSFNLPAEAIDRLREIGARLLRTSPDYQRLLRELPELP